MLIRVAALSLVLCACASPDDIQQVSGALSKPLSIAIPQPTEPLRYQSVSATPTARPQGLLTVARDYRGHLSALYDAATDVVRCTPLGSITWESSTHGWTEVQTECRIAEQMKGSTASSPSRTIAVRWQRTSSRVWLASGIDYVLFLRQVGAAYWRAPEVPATFAVTRGGSLNVLGTVVGLDEVRQLGKEH